MLQNVIHLHPDKAILLFQYLFLNGCIPEGFILLEAIGVTRIGGVADVTLDVDVERKMNGRIG